MTRSRFILALAAAVGTMLVGGAVPAAAQNNKPFYGVGYQGGISTLAPQDFERMRQGRVGTLRFMILWPGYERAGGTFFWQHIDRAVGMAAAQGVRSLPKIHQQRGPRTNAQRALLARFAGEMAKRYAPGGEFWGPGGEYARRYSNGAPPLPITTWQILNEQNARHHWGGRPKPRAYGLALRQAGRAIRQHHKGAEIVAGGMFANPQGKGSMPSPRYLNRLYRVKQIKRVLNTVAIHPYARNLKGLRRQVVGTRKVLRRNGHRKARVRLTEIGWGSAKRGHFLNKGPKGQARMLTKSFRLLRKNRKRWKIRGLNWFAWRDISGTPGGGRRICRFCPSAGLFQVNGTPKRSWQAFQRATRR